MSKHTVSDKVGKILWVQSGLNSRILEYILDTAGIESRELAVANTMAEAIDQSETFQADVILLDLYLSDGEGIEPVSRIMDAYGDVPIIIVTHLANEVFSRKVREMGVREYFVLGALDFVTLGAAIEDSWAQPSAPKKSFWRRLIGA